MSAAKHNPFVGLRPFESDESILFFGRQEQTVELLQRLHKNHFVGVVGSSGSGKSSLIRAGLIPGLKAGYLVNERDKWLIAVCKPGEGPLYNLASAILSELQKETSSGAVAALVQEIKEEGSDAIVALFQYVFDENRTNLFILVDQFEELFRFALESKSSLAKDEAIDYVNILLELAARAELPVYVVITMRSDFIGDCAQFYGLPEALNQSQYLVPRPTRVQLKNAIEGPVRLYGGKINPALVSRLLNDVQSVRDELPLLQHVLMRTWDYEIKSDNNGELDLHDYTEVGGIEKALSIHADEAMTGMDDAEKQVARLLFQSLTTTDDGGRKIRRPAHLSELIAITSLSKEKIIGIIDHFNADSRSFLVVNASSNANDPLIDISHESLIRQWETLSGWVDEETGSAKIYMRVSEAAALHKENKKDLISGTELQVAVSWRDTAKPNATWAGRYNGVYEETMAFVNNSEVNFENDKLEKEKQHKKKLLTTRIVALVLFLLTIGSVWIGIVALAARKNAVEANSETEHALKRFKVAEANEVGGHINEILERAEQLKKEYPDAYDSLRNEVINVLKKYPENENLKRKLDTLRSYKKTNQ